MTRAPPITTVFVNVGNVLLTDSWGPVMRQKAVDTLGIDIANVAKQSQLTFEGYKEGKVTLDEYLTWVVFHEKRFFSRAALTEFMLAQSEAHPEMLDLMRTLKTRVWAEDRCCWRRFLASLNLRELRRFTSSVCLTMLLFYRRLAVKISAQS